MALYQQRSPGEEFLHHPLLEQARFLPSILQRRDFGINVGKSLLGKRLLIRFGESAGHNPNQSHLYDRPAALQCMLVVAV